MFFVEALSAELVEPLPPPPLLDVSIFIVLYSLDIIAVLFYMIGYKHLGDNQ